MGLEAIYRRSNPDASGQAFARAQVEYSRFIGEAYLKAYQNVPETKAGIGAYLRLYNDERPHQALDYQTPYQVFQAGRRLVDVMGGKKPTTAPEPKRRCPPNREVVSWHGLDLCHW